MTPQEIADEATSLGFDILLDTVEGTVFLREDVWPITSEPQDEVAERLEQIRGILRSKGLSLKEAEQDHDTIWGYVIEGG